MARTTVRTFENMFANKRDAMRNYKNVFLSEIPDMYHYFVVNFNENIAANCLERAIFEKVRKFEISLLTGAELMKIVIATDKMVGAEDF